MIGAEFEWLDFITERIRGLNGERLDEEFRRALVDLMASDIHLSRQARDLFAGELRNHFFPPAPAERRAHKRNFETQMFGMAREHLIEKLREDGSASPAADADAILAEIAGRASPEAFQKAMRRARAESGVPHPDKNS